MNPPLIHIYEDALALAAAAALEASELLSRAPAERPLLVCLSGGSTPRPFHRVLATTYLDVIPWERIHIFWGDERYVPPDHPESNVRMAEETLLRDVPIPADQVHRISWSEGRSLEEAAALYDEELRRVAGGRGDVTFDLTVLGLGDDGHTASLFPGTPVLSETERWAAPGQAPPTAAVRERITLTYPALNASRHVFFLVAGPGKREPLRAILDDPTSAGNRFPAAAVSAAEQLHWFVDASAYGG